MCNASWIGQAFRGNKTSLKLSTDSPCVPIYVQLFLYISLTHTHARTLSKLHPLQPYGNFLHLVTNFTQHPDPFPKEHKQTGTEKPMQWRPYA